MYCRLNCNDNIRIVAIFKFGIRTNILNIPVREIQKDFLKTVCGDDFSSGIVQAHPLKSRLCWGCPLTSDIIGEENENFVRLSYLHPRKME